MGGDRRINNVSTKLAQSRQGACLVPAHEAREPDHVDGHDGGQFAIGPLD
jgi:hypothetical protein